MGTKLTVVLANGQKDEHQDADHSVTAGGVLTIKVPKNGLEGTRVTTYSPPAWISIETTEYHTQGLNNLNVGGSPITFGH
ncbi:hypothetical protein MTY66_63760 (plasmid) [Mycolicibacterium sp. TY66]|uniref:hypothetical protein n=1 Tax=unclassified Mycolicibacterium TaxID=2636767 RepID=UPI001BB31213|nr:MULTISPECIES: hypothetical protein [unclassified Mycolicibacterium]BCI84751.1 hypothetical protein MTY66_63760 [Mycolicibacterium sp. TY66]BCJ84965.1 hypothetical protein MTY81_63380 [Mycolicibacterium sp. TY81]